MTRSALIAAILMLLATPATTQALTPEQIADAAWPDSPCHGQTIVDIPKVGIIATDTGQALAGAASGLATDENGIPVLPFRAERCETTTDPEVYAAMTPQQKCEYRVHEAGHLAGLQHAAPGPMTADPGRRWYGPCHTLRENARHDLEAMVPGGAQVLCGKWQGRAFTCIASWSSDSGRYSERRYRVRVRGELYAFRRIRPPR